MVERGKPGVNTVHRITPCTEEPGGGGRKCVGVDVGMTSAGEKGGEGLEERPRLFCTAHCEIIHIVHKSPLTL